MTRTDGEGVQGSRGPIPNEREGNSGGGRATVSDSGEIERFSFVERLLHWLSAAGFVYAAISGLALWTPGFYGLAALLGGGTLVRSWHPWSGVLFALVLSEVFRRWAGQMRIDRQDRQWLAQSHRYAMNEDAGLPAVGRFNGGQKMLFWLQAVSCLLLLASGLILWFPESTSQGLRLAAVLIHPIASIVSIFLIIVHIYMGTLAVPGALRAMLHGKVSRSWAKSHHYRWYRDRSGN